MTHPELIDKKSVLTALRPAPAPRVHVFITSKHFDLTFFTSRLSRAWEKQSLIDYDDRRWPLPIFKG